MINWWRKEEVELLKKLYPVIRIKELIKYFPKRNKGTIATKALSLGLASAKLWQDNENKILLAKFTKSPKEELLRLFPSRTWGAVIAQGERLGLKRERNHPRLQVNEDYFKKWSPNMAYILGFTLADGCIIKGTYKGYSDALKFGVQFKDKDILEKIKKELHSEHSISIGKNAAHLCITSQKIVDSLKRLGITYQKSLKETVPKIPSYYSKDFIRGLIDGDGGISFDNKGHPTLRLCGGINTITFVKNYFWKKLNCFSSIGQKKFSVTAKSYLYGIDYRSTTAKKIILFLYVDASLYLDRKYELALKCQNLQIKKRANFNYINKLRKQLRNNKETHE